MSFFDDEDDFDSIVREFFGNRNLERKQEEVIEGEEEDRILDFFESNGKVYLILEISGYDYDDIFIKFKDRKILIEARKQGLKGVQSYLAQRLTSGMKISKTLPEFLVRKKFDYTVKNGILEVIFKKNG
jgi:HSP20 family molecular chaperone IbpA